MTMFMQVLPRYRAKKMCCIQDSTTDRPNLTSLIEELGYELEYRDESDFSGDLSDGQKGELNEYSCLIIGYALTEASLDYSSAWASLTVPIMSNNTQMVQSDRWQWLPDNADKNLSFGTSSQTYNTGHAIWTGLSSSSLDYYSPSATVYGSDNQLTSGNGIALEGTDGRVAVWNAGTAYNSGDPTPQSRRGWLSTRSGDPLTNAMAEFQQFYKNMLEWLMGNL